MKFRYLNRTRDLSGWYDKLDLRDGRGEERREGTLSRLTSGFNPSRLRSDLAIFLRELYPLSGAGDLPREYLAYLKTYAVNTPSQFSFKCWCEWILNRPILEGPIQYWILDFRCHRKSKCSEWLLWKNGIIFLCRISRIKLGSYSILTSRWLIE